MKNRILCFTLILTIFFSALLTGIAADILTYDVSFTNASYSSSTTGIDFGRAGDQWKRAQTFMAVNGGDLTSVIVKIRKVIDAETPSSPGDVVASLYATDVLGGITGNALATVQASGASVSSSGWTELEIPLAYEGMIAGKLYAVILTQTTTTGRYGWYGSFDANNPNWWRPEVYNPQIRQPDYDGDLPSFKITDWGEIVDDSRCGDLWLKANYTPGEVNPPPDTDGPQESLKALYDKDVMDGGLSYYMDRVLARPGVDPSLKEDSGLMTRGRALYTKVKDENINNPLLTEFGFGGNMRYVKGDNSGYTITINGYGASNFSEDVSKRIDYPSHWTSFYKGNLGNSNSGLEVITKRFITENNTAVTVLDITNTTAAQKNASISLTAPNTIVEETDLVKQIRIDYRNITVKASLDGGSVSSGRLVKSVSIPAGETVSVKAQMGFIDPKDTVTSEEYNTFTGYTSDQAFKNHLSTYHSWWHENIPYMWVSDPVMQKMTAYRWWITRMNTVDASTVNYPFPTSMEGVFGYNNAIINAVPWQMDEFRYLRSPLLEYGTWADAVFAAKGGIYRDNPAGVWGVKPQHYISKAGWESYKIHGGQIDFLTAVANAGAGDVMGTKEEFGSPSNYLYGIQYDAWDNDTASLARSGAQQRIDTAALAWANANAVAEMYAAAGHTAQASTYQTFANNIVSANITNSTTRLWDNTNKHFLMKMTSGGAWNTFKDINNYYGFMVGMVPKNSGYDQALRVWNDPSQFPTWPMYVSNSADYTTIQGSPLYADRSRNYSPGNIAITLKMYAAAIKQYDTTAITGEHYGTLLRKYTEICFANKNFNYPDTNEFWNGNPDTPYRSWIHHNFHSQYNTLLIEDVMGITPRDDKIIELNPIDIGLDAFKLSQVNYHGKDIAVTLDETGYKLFVDDTLSAHLDGLCHFTWNSETGAVTVLDGGGAAVLANDSTPDFKSAYDITYDEGRVADVINAVIGYMPGDSIVAKDNMPGQSEVPENDGSYKLIPVNGSDFEDNFNLDFGDYNGDQYKRAQMFVAKEGGEISGVQFMIQNKTATRDVTVELYSAGMDDGPGQSLARTTIPVSKVSKGSMCVVTADLYYNLEKGKSYYIVLGQAAGGSGIYCWAISAKSFGSGEQAVQAGHGGALSMYKIERSGGGDGTKTNESSLGDCYLEVFWQNPNIISVYKHMKRLVSGTSSPADDYDSNTHIDALDSLFLLKYVLRII